MAVGAAARKQAVGLETQSNYFEQKLVRDSCEIEATSTYCTASISRYGISFQGFSVTNAPPEIILLSVVVRRRPTTSSDRLNLAHQSSWTAKGDRSIGQQLTTTEDPGEHSRYILLTIIQPVKVVQEDSGTHRNSVCIDVTSSSALCTIVVEVYIYDTVSSGPAHVKLYQLQCDFWFQVSCENAKGFWTL